MITFQDLDLSNPLRNSIEELGFVNPTPIQEEAFPIIRSGKDVVGIAQTGTGKTFAYMLPILRDLKFSKQVHPRVLVVVPTRELVVQVVSEIEKLTEFMSIHTVGVFGGRPLSRHKEAVAQGADIIVATPGRLYDLAVSNMLKLRSIQKLVIDEVDVMLDLGFRFQLLNIVDLSLLNSAQTVTADSNGDWFISLSVLDLGNEYYFAIVDPVTGDFIVKNTENDLVGTGVLDTEPDDGLIGLGSEPLLADFDESEEQMAQGTEPQPLGESIDLSMVMTDTSTDSTIAEGAAPLELSIDDVLTDSEQTDVLALDTGNESQSLAFNGEPEVTSDAANDIQNGSEELIKKLIEGGNNAIDI